VAKERGSPPEKDGYCDVTLNRDDQRWAYPRKALGFAPSDDLFQRNSLREPVGAGWQEIEVN
jgi:hypothetical protein